jgi:hypothetical protein
LHAVGKEELPQGGVVELTPIVILDALDLVAEVLTKENNWVIVEKV